MARAVGDRRRRSSVRPSRRAARDAEPRRAGRRLGAALGGAICPPGCRQLAPDSALLAGLNDAGLPAGPQWVSLWTTQDEVVTPPDSARIDGAVDVPVQQVCPSAQVAHGTLPTAPASSALVLQALGVAPFTVPTTCPV